MKIAIVGGTGLLGSNLFNLYKKSCDVRCYSRKQSINLDIASSYIINFNKLDIELQKHFDKWKPDILINAVAIVDLQFCEDHYDLAFKINCVLAKDLALIAKQNQIYYIHISTDHFYCDTKIKHNENDKVLLLNNYAKTKYIAEKEIEKINNKVLIIRTNIIGFRNNDKDTFFEWLVHSFLKNIDVEYYENYYTSPIEVNQLGEILLKCYSKKLVGIYNIGSSNVISKYDFALKVALKFNFNVKNIKKLYYKNNSYLKRALTLGLDVSKIESDLNMKMPDIDLVIEKLYKIYKGEK